MNIINLFEFFILLIVMIILLPIGVVGLMFFLYPRKAIESAMVRGNPENRFSSTSIFVWRFLLGGFFMFAGFGVPIFLFFSILIDRLN